MLFTYEQADNVCARYLKMFIYKMKFINFYFCNSRYTNISFYSKFIVEFYKILNKIDFIFIVDSLTINKIFGYGYKLIQNCE